MISAVILFLSLSSQWVRADIRELVQQASQPEVMFAKTTTYDSLLARITDCGKEAAGELLDLADTPWAWEFEVVRVALQRVGGPAREVILERLQREGLVENESARLLVLFETLGLAGDESSLVVYLRGESPVNIVPALRCLAAFGEPTKSLDMVFPLLSADNDHVRLAAVWAVGELCRRSTGYSIPDGITDLLKSLTSDPVLQVRLTAVEALEASGIPVPEERK